MRKLTKSIATLAIMAVLTGCGGDSINDAINHAIAQTFFKSDSVVTIPDNNSAGVVSTIDVTTDYHAVKVFVVSVSILHPRVSDLKISLISPSGTSVMLSNKRGGNAHAMNVNFEDNSTKSIVTATEPLETYYKPEEMLANFNGEDPNGTWKLKVVDNRASKSGKITDWGMILSKDK